MKSRKTLINVTVSSIYQIVTIICGLITPRLFLTAFGSTYYGAFSSVGQFLGIISALSMGIPGASRLELYKLLSISDNEGISKVVKATQKYSKKVGVIIIFYAALLCFVYPYISNSDLLFAENAIIIVIVAFGLFIEYFFGMAYYNVIDADQKQYIRFALRIFATIANTLVVVLLIRLGYNVFTVKLASSMVFAITPFFVYLYVKNTYHIDNSVETDMSVIPERKNVLIHSISAFVYEHVDVFVLTIFLDVKYVAIYTIYHTIIHYLRLLLEIFTGDLESVFGTLWTNKERDRVDSLFSGYETFAFMFICVVFSCAGLLIMPFVALYTAGVHDINYYHIDIGILIVLSEALYCVRDPYRILIQATGSYEQTKVGAIMEAATNAILSVVLTACLGFNGVLVGTVVSTLITIIQFSWFSDVKLLNRKYVIFFKRLIWTVITMALIVGVCSVLKLGNVEHIDNWRRWILEGVGVFLISASMTVISTIIFYRKDLYVILNKVKVALFARNKS